MSQSNRNPQRKREFAQEACIWFLLGLGKYVPDRHVRPARREARRVLRELDRRAA